MQSMQERPPTQLAAWEHDGIEYFICFAVVLLCHTNYYKQKEFMFSATIKDIGRNQS